MASQRAIYNTKTILSIFTYKLVLFLFSFLSLMPTIDRTVRYFPGGEKGRNEDAKQKMGGKTNRGKSRERTGTGGVKKAGQVSTSITRSVEHMPRFHTPETTRPDPTAFSTAENNHRGIRLRAVSQICLHGIRSRVWFFSLFPFFFPPPFFFSRERKCDTGEFLWNTVYSPRQERQQTKFVNFVNFLY